MQDVTTETHVARLHEELHTTLQRYVERRRPTIDVIATVAASFAAEMVASVSLSPNVDSVKFEEMFFTRLREELDRFKQEYAH